VAELPTQRDFDDFAAWSGRDVVGPDGDRLGAVDAIFLDEATGVPEWVLVDLDDGDAFVPLAGATVEERSIRVDQAADRVAAAPRVEVGETLSVADEKRLYEHYGLNYSREESATVLPEGATAGEERPRLRKYVGAPVPAPAGEEETSAAGSEPRDTAAADPMAPRNLSDATPSQLPPEPPKALPPEDGFQAHQQLEPPGSRLPTALPAVLAGAIAALIALLAIRRRRR
jgi:hypothetical protein